MSDRQFRRKVFEELQNAGTIDGLKGTLRSRLVGVLQRRDPGVFQGSGPGPGQHCCGSAANSSYVEYLQHQNYALRPVRVPTRVRLDESAGDDQGRARARVLCLGPVGGAVHAPNRTSKGGSRLFSWASCKRSWTPGPVGRVVRSPPRRTTTTVPPSPQARPD